MHSAKLCFALVVLALLVPRNVSAQAALGAQGAEGEPNRLQQWLVPTPDPATPAHAVLFRPPGDGPFPLALIAHASTQNVLRRAQMPQPEYRALSALLVARGFAVLVPERLGHGATGGKYLEDQGGCDEADYSRAGRATAAEIAAAHGLPAPATLHPARRYGDRRPLRRRMGCAGAGRRAAARRCGGDCIRAGPRRPRQRFSEPGLRAAHADGRGSRIRQNRAGAGHLAGVRQ